MRIVFKTIAASILLSNLGVTVSAQTFEWAKQIGGTQNVYPHSLALDNFGNSYNTGYFEGTVDFDPNGGVSNLTAIGQRDIYIQKLSTTGNLIWAKSMGGPATDYAKFITVDSLGNVFTVGSFDGTVDFDPNGGVSNLTSAGGSDFYLQKLDADGNLIWVKQFAGPNDDLAESIALDSDLNIYMTGYYSGTVDFDPNIGISNLTSGGGTDIFVVKLDTSGGFVWAKSMGGASSDYGRSIKIDNSGNLYSIGSFGYTADFDPSAGIYNLTCSGSHEFYIQKLNFNGDFIWAKSTEGSMLGWGSSEGVSLTIDKFDNLYSTGSYSGSVDFDPNVGTTVFTSQGNIDIFIQKLSTTGNFIWAKSFGGTGQDTPGAIALDKFDNVYTTGQFLNTVDFDPGAGTINLTATGGNNIFIQKLNSNGSFIWARNTTGTSNSYGTSIAVDQLGSVYSTGFFKLTADFDPNVGTYNLTSLGLYDGFVQKLNQCINNPGIDIQTACGSYTWIDGNIYTSNNNTATFNLVGGSVNGCDSLVTLDLTINTVNVGVTTNDPSITANVISASYQWLDCNNSNSIISGETSQTFTSASNGDFSVEITENGCTDTSSCITISTIGIGENLLFNQVSIYPNPSQGLINIDLGNLKDVSIKVFNITGQLIYKNENINTPVYQLEIKKSSGLYFIELSSNNESEKYKLLLE